MSPLVVISRTFWEESRTTALCRSRADTDTCVDYGAQDGSGLSILRDGDVCSASSTDVDDESFGSPSFSWADEPEDVEFSLPYPLTALAGPFDAGASGEDLTYLQPLRDGAGATSGDESPGTTITLRRLPRTPCFRRERVLELLDASGFQELYDFVYVPRNFKSLKCLGYATVNFLVPETATAAVKLLNNINLDECVIEAEFSRSHTSLQSLIRRYQNSPVVEPGVPDDLKPLIFERGVRVPFPMSDPVDVSLDPVQLVGASSELLINMTEDFKAPLPLNGASQFDSDALSESQAESSSCDSSIAVLEHVAIEAPVIPSNSEADCRMADCQTSEEVQCAILCNIQDGDSEATDATAVTLRRLPKTETLGRERIVELLNSSGFEGLYNFVYVPRSFKTTKIFGYATVNFESRDSAISAISLLGGTCIDGCKVEVEFCKTHRNLSCLIERYQNSPVIQQDVPDDSKPLLFEQGRRVPFPPATCA